MSGLRGKPYYQYFKNIKTECIITVRHWIGGVMTIRENGLRPIKFTTSIWEVHPLNGLNRIRMMTSALSGIYGIPSPTVNFGSREVYYIIAERIEIPKISAVSLLHEFRHHMQNYNKQHYRDKEDDARGWSISLFAQALPDAFDRAWQQGKVWYLPPYNANWKQEVGI